MKIKTLITNIFAGSVLAMIFAASALAQSHPVVGGGGADPENPEVVRAAEFAANQKGLDLTAIFAVEKQMVAGVIYRVCMEVGNEEDETMQVLAEIFVSLRGDKMTLRGWSEEECAAPEEDPQTGIF